MTGTRGSGCGIGPVYAVDGSGTSVRELRTSEEIEIHPTHTFVPSRWSPPVCVRRCGYGSYGVSRVEDYVRSKRCMLSELQESMTL